MLAAMHRHAWHAVPWVTYLVSYSSFFVLDVLAKLAALRQAYTTPPLNGDLNSIVLLDLLHSFDYRLAAAVLLEQHQRRMRAVYSTAEKHELRCTEKSPSLGSPAPASQLFKLLPAADQRTKAVGTPIPVRLALTFGQAGPRQRVLRLAGWCGVRGPGKSPRLAAQSKTESTRDSGCFLIDSHEAGELIYKLSLELFAGIAQACSPRTGCAFGKQVFARNAQPDAGRLVTLRI